MKNFSLKSISLAAGMAIAGTTGAVEIDWTGTNIYIKFLDGDQLAEATGSIDTASGADQGQFSELELRMRATISPQVEAGARVQSRSSAAYWSEYGFDNEDGTTENHKKYMKLRGAYVNLTPGYDSLTLARIGSSDWGMFDPYTFGKMRYIDRDNFNGLYFNGPMGNGSWEFARVSLAKFLGAGWSTGNLIGNDAAYLAQFKQEAGDFDITAIVEHVSDREADTSDTYTYDGIDSESRMINNIAGLKAEGSILDGLDIKAAYYQSRFDVDGVQYADWANALGNNYRDDASSLNIDWSETFIDGLTFNYQYFDIGAGYVTTTGARRESDVLLTEGSEAAWFDHGNALWIGGRANEMLQVPVVIRDNDFTDFDETGAESSVGWKGHTLVTNLDVADTPMSLELTSIDYNSNWQDWGGEQNVFNVMSWAGATGPGFKEDQDRSTTIIVYKANHVFDVGGGLDTTFKIKSVNDEDKLDTTTSADDSKTEDLGYSITFGNQLSNDLYGSISYGIYSRDITVGTTKYDNDKDIISLNFNYNLAGFEAGILTQWIDGDGWINHDNDDGTTPLEFGSLKQYRLKAYAKVLF